MPEEEQHREVYAWAGLALYHAQVLEHGLVNLLLVVRLSDVSLPVEFASADDFYSAHFRLMMGKLLKRVRDHGCLPAGIEARLSDLLRRRNFLVHEYFRERFELLLDTNGRQTITNELAAFINEVQNVDRELEEMMCTFGSKYGVTKETITRALDEIRQRPTS